MSSFSIVVPWQPSGPEREDALAWVRSFWSARYPDAPIVLGECSDGDWSKGAAIRAGLDRVENGIVVVADADVYLAEPAALDRAVSMVASGEAEWAIPHWQVWRLDRRTTAAVLVDPPGDEPEDWPATRCDETPYTGVECGGMVVLPTATARAVPCDPRFIGWGGQDYAWSFALRALMGRPWRARSRLYHLWHPPQERESRQIGSVANELLRQRYARARRNPTAMRALCAEAIVALAAVE